VGVVIVTVIFAHFDQSGAILGHIGVILQRNLEYVY